MTSDAALVALAEAGDDASYDELHRRHAVAAWGLAQAITRDDVTALAAVDKAVPAVFAAIDRGSYPVGLPVRWAVLAATRAAALSLLHGSPWTGAPHNRDVVDRAFSGLPECWRSALWLVEVERLRPLDAARPLRLTPGDAAAMIERARAGFTDRYVRLAGAGRSGECRLVLPLLPGLVARTLAPHETADVDQHLAGCRPCRTSSIELADLGATLRSIALPTPLLAMKRHRPKASAVRARARGVPALAAAIIGLLGFSSLAAVARDAPNAAQQLASPVEAREPVRDPGTVPGLVTPIAAPADVRSEAPSLTQASFAAPVPEATVVAMEGAEATPAHLPAAAPAPATRHGQRAAAPVADETTGGGEPEAPDGHRSSSSDHEHAGGGPGAEQAAPPPAPSPPPESGDDDAPVAVAAEAGAVSVDVTVDPASSEPLGLDVTIPGPTGLSALGSGA